VVSVARHEVRRTHQQVISGVVRDRDDDRDPFKRWIDGLRVLHHIGIRPGSL